MERHPMFLDWQNTGGPGKGDYTTKINFSINTLISHFTDLEKTTTQEFIWNHKRPWITKEHCLGNAAPSLELHQSHRTNPTRYCYKNGWVGKWITLEDPKMKQQIIYAQIILTKEIKTACSVLAKLDFFHLYNQFTMNQRPWFKTWNAETSRNP